MTILDLLMKLTAGAGLPNLLALLEDLAVKAPELAPELRVWITALGSATSTANLSNLALAVTKELGEIAKGKIDPRVHPSDAI